MSSNDIVAKPVLAFCGLTHLCLCSGVAAAEKGYTVILFDPDPARVAAVNAGQLPVIEPDLDDLFQRTRSRLSVTHTATDLRAASLVYLAADVPTDDRGQSDLGPIDDLLRAVKPALAQDATLVVLSQVPPGFTRSLSARFGGFDGPLHYQVETLIFGRAMERALEPERFIIGCFDPALPLPRALKEFLGVFSCPILPMRLESAELAKISINMCLVASISVANTLAELCEKLGADWTEISGSLKLDRRIGPFAYLAPGLGLAGGNLERDLATIVQLGQRHSTDTSLVSAAIENSAKRKNWAWQTLQARLLDRQPDATIAVLGIAYKENTHSTKNSPALALTANMPGRAIRVHDPVVPASAVGTHAIPCADPLECVTGADAVLLMTPWPIYRELDPTALANRMRGRLLIDPYRMIDPKAATSAGLEHVSLGVGASFDGALAC